MVSNPTIETPKRRVVLVGSGSCLPEKKLTNEDLMDIVEVHDH